MTISIAMATYNGARFLREQLDSLVRQTLPPSELVVCDDGSSDATLEILAEFATAAPFPVHVHRNEKRLGYGDNFLKAARLCAGELVAFCDQDDVWKETKLERCAAEFADPKMTLVIHSADLVDGQLKPLGGACPHFPMTVRHEPLSVDPGLILQGFAMVFPSRLLHYADVHRRPRTQLAVDAPLPHDLWLFFFASALGRTAFLADRLASYRQHTTNTVGVPPSSLQATLRQTQATRGAAYLWIADLNREYADYFRDLSCAQTGDTAAEMRRAADHYLALAATYAGRATLYDVSLGRLQRIANFAQMARRYSYRSRARGGLGHRALAKDAFCTLVRL